MQDSGSIWIIVVSPEPTKIWFFLLLLLFITYDIWHLFFENNNIVVATGKVVWTLSNSLLGSLHTVHTIKEVACFMLWVWYVEYLCMCQYKSFWELMWVVQNSN